MNESEIRKYANLMRELGLTGLEINKDSSTVRLERNVSVREANPLKTDSQDDCAAAKNEQEDYISIKSPMVGVFYSSPAENAEPYVSLGDRVQKGKTLCIVEAMKLLNEIPSEIDGTISKICVSNGQNVEYGTELFRLKR